MLGFYVEGFVKYIPMCTICVTMIDGIYQCVDTLDLVYSSIAKAFHGNMSLQISNVKDLFDRSTFSNLLIIIWNHIHFRSVRQTVFKIKSF